MNKKQVTYCAKDKITPWKSGNSVTIAMGCSKEYVPYLLVCLYSLVYNSSKSANYDIIIFEKNITEEQKQIITNFIPNNNINISFFNTTELLEDSNLYIADHYFSEACYYRIFAPYVLKNFRKVIFTDIDIIFNSDIKNLYNYEIGEQYILGATIEPIWHYFIDKDIIVHDVDIKDYTKNVLNLQNKYKYFNTGIMLYNIPIANKYDFSQKVFENVKVNKYLYQEQCSINKLFNDKIYELDNSWNCGIYNDHNNQITPYLPVNYSIDQANIVHYLGPYKPWLYPEFERAELWWKYARFTPYYEVIIKNMTEYTINNLYNQTKTGMFALNHYKLNCLNYWKSKILSNITLGATKQHYLKKKAYLRDLIKVAKEYK